MKRQNIGKRLLILMLTVMMLFPMTGIDAAAAVGDLSNVSTGLDGNIDTADTISLPVKILDYEADGMLFEFAESNAYDGNDVDGDGVTGHDPQTAMDFGATWAADFASQTSLDKITNSMYGDFWGNTKKTLNTENSYASYLRATWAKNSEYAPLNHYGRTGVIMPNDLAGKTLNSVRYLVLVYRSNVTSGNIGFFVEREKADRNNENNRVGDLTFKSDGDKYWTYAVYDLKQGNLKNTWDSYGGATAIWTTLPMAKSGQYIDIAHVALFSNKDQAAAFGEYALTDGSDRGDNRGFGLLRSSRNQANGTNYKGIIDETTTVKQLNTYGDTTSIDFSTLNTLGYKLLGTFGNKGIANVGLLESGLSAEGTPVYKKEVVTYVAKLLQHSLEIPERTSDGWKNYRYVKGTASSVYGGTDLATALRTKINKNMGSYDSASGKDLVGTWSEVGGNIASYYDAAYFLLNSIFVSGSYNVEQADCDYLVLSAGTDSETKDKVYVFDGGFTTSATPADAKMAIQYNKDNNTIQNTSAAGKTYFVYEGESTTTLNPFLPITDRNTADGMTKNPYYQDDGVVNGVKKQATKDTLYKRNYGFTVVSEGEFVYHADDELFFEFEGDDDVYLFINDELVLDIGSAHSIDKVRFELNDYVNAAKAGTLGSDARNKALALEEGNTYSFKFYYMERHSYGSNIRIMTNIKVTDPNMITTKTAWQNGTQLDFGSIVDPQQVVEYGFAITNNGEENLYNLTFTDNDIGVTLDSANGLKVTGKRVSDVNGEPLEATDLTACVSHPDYEDINVTFADDAALEQFLKELTASGTAEGEGLFSNATVSIRGIGYKLSDEQKAAGVFDNTVLTTSTNKTGSKTLQGQAAMRVFVPADPMYYEWAGHELKVTKAKLVDDVLTAARQQDNILNEKVPNLTKDNVNKIELTTKAGNAISSSEVTIDSKYDLTIKYSTTGSKVFYVKITYNGSKNTVVVPVLVNVTDVKDSVYVLDYGLAADLTDSNELLKNDTLTVPGRNTDSSLIAVGKDGTYSSNEITFTGETDNVVDGQNGTFTLNEQKLTYKPTDFMEEVDTVQVAVNVYEKDITPSKITGTLNINSEVEMYKNVNVLPATVVYYEDDFPAIKYKGIDYTIEQDGTVTNLEVKGTNSNISGGTSSGLNQGVDQKENYGHDNVYEVANNTDSSAGTLKTITINEDNSGTVAYFEFKGTGFELISRTTAEAGATIIVTVKDSSGNVVKRIPVITEFDNYYTGEGGDEKIYQVPVIRVDDLALNTYTVEITGILKRDYTGETPKVVDSYLYVDGLRIYQPLGAENENYTPEENGADFTEIRNLIADGAVAVVEWLDDVTTSVSSGTHTWVENKNNDDAIGDAGENGTVIEDNVVSSVDDYLLYGPNNEVYIDGTFSQGALMFYVEEDSDSEVHNLQIAMRGIDEGLFYGADSTGVEALVEYAVPGDDGESVEWKELATLVSSTEQYYTIDYTECVYVEGMGYQVVIRVTDPDFAKIDNGEMTEDQDTDNSMVSFSTLKLNGLTIVAEKADGDSVFGDAATFMFNNGFVREEEEAGTMNLSPSETDETGTQPEDGTEGTEGADGTEGQPEDGADGTEGQPEDGTEGTEGADGTDGQPEDGTEGTEGADGTDDQPEDGTEGTDGTDTVTE